MATKRQTKLEAPPPDRHDFREAPTAKREIPSELRDPEPAAFVTTKLRKAEIDKLLEKSAAGGSIKDQSGMRVRISEDDIARFERRSRETLPAPPDPKLLAHDDQDD